MNQFMELAFVQAAQGFKKHQGGFFGAVIVKDGQVVGQGHNRVLVDNDPTCHGEIDAIRNACQNLGTYDLTGCEIYSTSEPCPMCLSAIVWANIKKVYYSLTIHDAHMIGYRDEILYRDMTITTDKIDVMLEQIDYEECQVRYQKITGKRLAPIY